MREYGIEVPKIMNDIVLMRRESVIMRFVIHRRIAGTVFVVEIYL